MTRQWLILLIAVLSRPIHRYSDPQRNIQDGAMFVLANGTNPEAVLMLEARVQASGLGWFMGFARLGHAEMHVFLDEQPIWNVLRVNPKSLRENYWLSFIDAND